MDVIKAHIILSPFYEDLKKQNKNSNKNHQLSDIFTCKERNVYMKVLNCRWIPVPSEHKRVLWIS